MEAQLKMVAEMQARRGPLAESPAVLATGSDYIKRLRERAKIAMLYPEHASDQDRKAAWVLMSTSSYNADLAAVKCQISSKDLEALNMRETIRSEVPVTMTIPVKRGKRKQPATAGLFTSFRRKRQNTAQSTGSAEDDHVPMQDL
eukprot:27585_1